MISLQKLILSAALALCISAPAFAGAPVTLRGEIFTEGRVTLGDLFDNAGRAADIVVAPAPPPGGSVMIDAATLQRAAIANGLSWTNERGIRRVIVRAGASAGATVPTAAGQSAPAAKGVQILTWTRAIDAGELIAAEDLTWSLMPAQPAGTPRDADALIGKVAKRPVRRGAAASTRDVGLPQVIKKDDMITVAYAAGGVEVSLQAKAMGSASVGEPVTVTNLQSKKVFQVIASGPGRAVVGPQAQALRASQTVAAR